MLEYAVNFLKHVLSAGPVGTQTLLDLARTEGIDPATLHRAAAELKCIVERKGAGTNSVAYWRLLPVKPGNASR